MTRRLIMYLVSSSMVSLLVWLGGRAVTGPSMDVSLGVGAGIAFVVQMVSAILLVRAGAERRFIAYSVGILVRFLTLAIVALVVVPKLDLAAPPALISLVAVFFATTLLEPLLFQRGELMNAEATE